MKAQNISICVPNEGCNKNCKYCISKMTGYTKMNKNLIRRNLPKVKKIADKMGVTTILLTGKGEPLFNKESISYTMWFIETFKDHMVELQTNGIALTILGEINKRLINNLFDTGLNTIAISVDEVNWIYEHRDLFEFLNEVGLMIRVTLNITNDFKRLLNIEQLIAICQKNYVKQLTLRQITVPNALRPLTPEKASVAQWIRENVDQKIYETYMKQFEEVKKKYPMIRKLNFGAKVYDVNGVAFTAFDYCIQDTNDEEDIRTLIFEEDGHLYDNWNSKASILF